MEQMFYRLSAYQCLLFNLSEHWLIHRSQMNTHGGIVHRS